MNEVTTAKRLARKNAATARDAEANATAGSDSIRLSLLNDQRIQKARFISCFVSFGSEVQTHQLINDFLSAGKSVCVPYCNGNDLQLFRIETLNELKEGSFGVLEPPQTLRATPGRLSQLAQCQVVIVPGLAFTTAGDRLGYGKGYYDRMLSTSLETWRIALAFDCQIVPEIPTTQYDVKMNTIMTESGIIEM